MIKVIRSIAVGSAILFASTGMAEAGQLLNKSGSGMKGSFKDAPMPVRKSSWYLRGDVGYVFDSKPEMLEGDFVFPGNSIGSPRKEAFDEKLDGTWSIGGGVGYYFTSRVRGDVTLDYRLETNVENSVEESAFTGTHKSKLSSLLVLANIYYDFGDRDRFSPYIGAGLGFARHKLANHELYNGSTLYGVTGDGTKTDVAGALMIGFSRSLLQYWKFDAGYRFTYVGDAEGSGDDTTLNIGRQMIQGMTNHELRIGIRYDF